ncbi:hypothetical protein ACFO0N_19125 [Halobium salinum]|uniref:Restriction endonuclease n=1 Tax=Halobium salinum TaxID=1364940 RepID=A0ABD5PGT6_9EURY|nr:hypothetical protein [Halobium salinum]
MDSVPAPLRRFHRPEYTGENRCLPCTVANTAIAALLTLVAGVVSPVLAVVVLGLSLGAIWLRGYLVPGTPELTKRYFPDWVLRRFDKGPATGVGAEARVEVDPDTPQVDPETELLAIGAVEEADDDLRITDEFRAAWRDSIESVRRDTAAHVGSLLALEEPRVEDREVACIVTDGGVERARWPSEAALLADLGAVPLLRERVANWDELDRVTQGQLLAGLRIFAENCPSCDGPLAFSEERTESCCRTVDVVTYDCGDCGARVLEVER